MRKSKYQKIYDFIKDNGFSYSYIRFDGSKLSIKICPKDYNFFCWKLTANSIEELNEEIFKLFTAIKEAKNEIQI